MEENERKMLLQEMNEFRRDVLSDGELRKAIEGFIIDEARLAEQIANNETIKQMRLGVSDILPKIDDVVKKLWDFWKNRRKKQDYTS